MLVQDEFQMRSQTVTSIVDKAQREYMRCHLRVEKMPSNLPSDVPTIVKRYCELLLGKLLLLLLLLFFFLMWRVTNIAENLDSSLFCNLEQSWAF